MNTNDYKYCNKHKVMRLKTETDCPQCLQIKLDAVEKENKRLNELVYAYEATRSPVAGKAKKTVRNIEGVIKIWASVINPDYKKIYKQIVDELTKG